MTTRREYFMRNPEKFYDYVRKWRGEKPPEQFDKYRARRNEEYIGSYLCDNMKDCETCPVPLDKDGLCDNRLDEFLDSPMPVRSGLDDIDPEDREAVQKILDAAAKNAREKKVMFYPSGMADLKKFNITDVVPPRADGAETAKKTSYEVKPPHYRITPDITVWGVIEPILSRTDYTGAENFMLGNIIKYILRADLKGGVEDYRKARTYLDELIESREKVEKE